ncbi:putative Nucleosome assembly protein (NAP) [Blattamonas nauphoetae]|uniref:Nucleosome assembly protein (NAP) n=1 Tax=Blattamonas nauphoetae TaxID=2049346 RepID=A0ABQ9XT57_9EUKA|nr:putative Nucleosome assembly protein (NAP) [Blattamonas nauphoetae]
MTSPEEQSTEVPEDTPSVEVVTKALESTELNTKNEAEAEGKSETDSDSDSDDGLASFIMYTPAMKHRISGMKKVYNQIVELLGQHRKEKETITEQYTAAKNAIIQKRHELISGDREPTDDELAPAKDLPFKDPEAAEKDTSPAKEDDGKGIKRFWKTCILNSETMGNVIYVWDEDALNYLKDAKTRRYILDDEKKDSFEPTVIFELTLIFDENPYFSNTELKRSVKVQMAGGNLISFYDKEEDEVLARGDIPQVPESPTIQWKEGKEIGVRTEKKKVKDKKTKKKVVKERRIVRPSFFDMFLSLPELQQKVDAVNECFDRYPPTKAELHGEKDTKEEEDDEDEECDCDRCRPGKLMIYQTGLPSIIQVLIGCMNTLAMTIVPHAFDYYAGIVVEEHDDDDDDDGDFFGDSDDDDSDDESDD